MKILLPQNRFRNYVFALESLGAEITFDENDDCGGLLLPGGGDIHPRLYGEEIDGSKNIDEQRDERETALLAKFVSMKKPVLGICRGVQLINVFFGGSLYQDIQDHTCFEDGDRLHGSHTDSAILKSIYSGSFTVNSSHHQAVKKLGNGLRAVQWAEDGTVEAVCHETLPVFGVQWHPERLREPTDGWKLIAWWLGEVNNAARGK